MNASNKERVVKNAGWLIGCKIVQSILGFFISTLTARYLGPSNFGAISYAMSLVTFVTPLMTLGFSSILVQEIVEKPEKEGEALGTALGMNLLSSLFCIIGIISFASLTSAGEKETIIICSLYSITLIAQAMEMIQYWFQAKLLSKYTAVVGIIAYIVVSTYKVFLLATGKSVYWFAIANAIDCAVIAIALRLIYHKIGSQKISFSWKRAGQMLSVSKYYIVSNMMITIFGQIDRIMLKHLVDDAATGFYAVAATLVGATSFVFSAIIDSMRPTIFNAKKLSDTQFELNVKRLYAIVIYLALAQSIATSIFAKWVVKLLYGAAYAPTAGILGVLVWYTPFSYIGAIRNIWILSEGKQRLLWKINLYGATVNILLNLWLIPYWGGIGAASAALFTQIFTNVLLGYMMKPLWRNNKLMIESIRPRFAFNFVKELLGKRSR